MDTAVAVWETDAPQQPVQAPAAAASVRGRAQRRRTAAVRAQRRGRRRHPGHTEFRRQLELALAVIDIATGQTLRSAPLFNAWIRPGPDGWRFIFSSLSDALALSPDGTTLAIAEGNDIRLFRADDLTPIAELVGHTDLVKSLEFSPDGSILASGSMDRTVRIWDTATGTEVDRSRGTRDPWSRSSSPPTGKRCTAAPTTAGCWRGISTGAGASSPRRLTGEPRTSIGSVAVPSPDGRAVVYVGSTASTGSTVRFLDVEAGTLGPAVDDPDGAALAAWLTPESGRVVTAAGNSLRIWDSRTAAMVDERAVVEPTSPRWPPRPTARPSSSATSRARCCAWTRRRCRRPGRR